LRSLGATFLVPCHGGPVEGEREIYDLLTAYSSAIQFVHDQTVRRINELRHPDEIGRLVKLPSSLASHPHLGEFYGTVEWSSKAVYQQYVGWFSGDVAEVLPLTPSERAQSLVAWLGVDR
jgi:alkyl sulfatase BDS1-like metallo-beta-lactamase superfamily hydrolase